MMITMESMVMTMIGIMEILETIQRQGTMEMMTAREMMIIMVILLII